jgi:hypothetical protein
LVSRLTGLKHIKSEYVLFLHETDTLLPEIQCILFEADVISAYKIDLTGRIGDFIFRKSLFDDYLIIKFPIFNADFTML